jgi:hypothetical protein
MVRGHLYHGMGVWGFGTTQVRRLMRGILMASFGCVTAVRFALHMGGLLSLNTISYVESIELLAFVLFLARACVGERCTDRRLQKVVRL